jgi:periplasmic copper chaperone A
VRRITTAAVLGTAAALALPVAAQAHVTVAPAQLPAEGYGKIDLSVPHGCEESPTTKLTVQLPDEVQSATPQVVPGWKITTKEGKLPKPYDNHGEQVTRGVREITWEGGPLDPHHLEVFGVSIKVSGNEGDQMAFKAIQECKKGETAWVEIPVEGEEEPPEPAPMVELVAAEEEHGASSAQEPATEEVETAPVAATTGDDDDGGSGLAIVALIVGALGLVAGIGGLVAARRANSTEGSGGRVATQT